jgi:D-glycero-D-manno-heptose 1,7-bisphosphate phosphatase
MLHRAIFLDRDGVINKEKNYLYKIKDFEFIEGIFDACIFLSKLNYKIIVITNQSGIARGYYSENDFNNLTKWMLREFIRNNIDVHDVFYCPHGPTSTCNCRKPQPGLFLKAKEKHNIDMKNSWAIGDKENDIKAANDSGIKNTILVKSGHKIVESESNATHIIDSIKYIRQVIKN